MRFRDRPIEQKIFILFLPICILPALVLILMVMTGSRLTFQETMGRELQSRAGLFANQFDIFLSQRLDEYRSLTKAFSAASDTQYRLDWTEFSSRAPIIVVASPSGSVEIHSQNPTQTEHVRTNWAAFFQYWIERIDSIPEQGVFTGLSLPLDDPEQPVHHSVLICPSSTGQIWYFFQPTQQLIAQFLSDLPRAPDQFLVYSTKGRLIYGTRDLEPSLRNQIESRMEAFDESGQWFVVKHGEERFLYTPVYSQQLMRMSEQAGMGANWAFLLDHDFSGFFASQEQLLWLSVLIALGLILILLLLSTRAARMIVEPIRDLREQAGLLADGEMEARVKVEGHDEIGRLAESFNQMAERLKENRLSLEQRIRENRLHTEHIHVINEMTHAIIQSQSLDSIFEILCRDLSKILDFDAIWIALFDGATRGLKVSHIHPRGLISLFDRGQIRLTRSIHGAATETGETLRGEFGPYSRNDFCESRIFESENFQSYLIAPLPSRHQIVGTITVASTTPEAYDEELAGVLTSLAGALAISIEQTHLFLQLAKAAQELERKVEERTQELQKANRKLIQTEKYFATGRLAGNLAHEINNPLNIIKNYLQLVRSNLIKAGGGRRRTDPNLDHLQIIDEETNRIARLVRKMLDLHRPVEEKVQPVDINAIIEEILALTRQTLEHSNIQVETDLNPNLPTPTASPDLIRQLFINLIRNAQDAIDHDGRIVIRTALFTQWDDEDPIDFIRTQIEDTGVGIPPEDLAKIFDPFFTTKPNEQGTGLGLCVSYSIVQVYRGTIEVESEPGKGTRVTVMLPDQKGDRAELGTHQSAIAGPGR